MYVDAVILIMWEYKPASSPSRVTIIHSVSTSARVGFRDWDP